MGMVGETLCSNLMRISDFHVVLDEKVGTFVFCISDSMLSEPVVNKRLEWKDEEEAKERMITMIIINRHRRRNRVLGSRNW